MTTTTLETRIDEILEAVETAILAIQLDDLRDGANNWAYVRVTPNGEVYSGREASRSVPGSEYFGRTPHTLTIWSDGKFRPQAGSTDGVFEWKPSLNGTEIGNDSTGQARDIADLGDAEITAKLAEGWYRFDLDRDSLVEPLTLDDAVKAELRSSLEAWATENLQADSQ